MKNKHLDDDTNFGKELIEGNKYCDYIHKCESLCYEKDTGKCDTYWFYTLYGEDWELNYLGI